MTHNRTVNVAQGYVHLQNYRHLRLLFMWFLSHGTIVTSSKEQLIATCPYSRFRFSLNFYRLYVLPIFNKNLRHAQTIRFLRSVRSEAKSTVPSYRSSHYPCQKKGFTYRFSLSLSKQQLYCIAIYPCQKSGFSLSKERF